MANVVNMTESRILWETDLVACLWGIILNALIGDGGEGRDLPSVDGIIPWLGAGLCEKGS